MNARLYLTTLPRGILPDLLAYDPFPRAHRTWVVSSTTFRGLRVFFTGFTRISQLGHEMTYLFGSYGANPPDIHVK
jgi:hypothetical protein